MQVERGVAEPASRPTTPKAARTRAALIEAGEALFAARGFSATRLEDVAAAVGIRRASIVYHFRDKRALYDAVLADVMAGLHERIAPLLRDDAPLGRRIESAVGAWVSYVGERPSLARLLLREVADATAGDAPPVRAHLGPFVTLAKEVMARGQGDPILSRAPADPAHMASTIAGATIFFVAALPTLSPDLRFDPLSESQIGEHRKQVLAITRRLLAGDDDGPREPEPGDPER